ncbi:MAG: hypothetical protein ABIB47_01455 [Candidatus Woesearchaeota archaeon]
MINPPRLEDLLNLFPFFQNKMRSPLRVELVSDGDSRLIHDDNRVVAYKDQRVALCITDGRGVKGSVVFTLPKDSLEAYTKAERKMVQFAKDIVEGLQAKSYDVDEHLGSIRKRGRYEL